MVTEHIISTTDKSTSDFIRAVGTSEVPLPWLRRKLGKYKVTKAINELRRVSQTFSVALQQHFIGAVQEIEESFAGLDRGVVEELSGVASQIDCEIIELFKKKHEGKMVDHVRIRPNIQAQAGKAATIIKVKR